ncbi:MAG: sugar phosphate isomerase/epimerase [Anaerolineae bacterium]|nr:sugar phosphate isomerase/epimerase [Anaerolineae bacterium]
MKPKVGLYSITYAGMWYDGPALSIKEFIDKAKGLGFPGVELDCRAPHALPYLLKERDRKEIVAHLEKRDVELSALAANNDFSSPVTEHRDANIQMVVDMIRLCKDLGAPVLRIFTAWMGSSKRDGMGTYEIARPGYDRAFPDTTFSERWQYCLEAFKIVTKYAEEDGVILALQNHPPVVRNSMDCLTMANEVNSPNFRLSFDISGERAWQDTNWVLAAARRIGDCWAHSHYGGDYKRNPDGTVEKSPLGRAMGPREGNMSWNHEAWVQAMYEVGYKGYVNYEGCTPTYTSTGRLIPMKVMDERVEMGRDYMLQLMSKYDWK